MQDIFIRCKFLLILKEDSCFIIIYTGQSSFGGFYCNLLLSLNNYFRKDRVSQIKLKQSDSKLSSDPQLLLQPVLIINLSTEALESLNHGIIAMYVASQR